MLDEQKKQIEDCNNKVKELTGERPKLFRPPYGDYNTTVVQSVKSLNMYCVQWDIDSLDWKDPTPAEMVDRIVPKLQNGSIILMHNGAKNTPEALPMIIISIKRTLLKNPLNTSSFFSNLTSSEENFLSDNFTNYPPIIQTL